MYKHLIQLVVVVVVVVAICASTMANGQSTEGPLKQAITKADESMAKGVDRASEVAQTIETKMDNFVNPPEHVPGQHNLAVSAVRGTGRLLRNVTVESGKFVGSVGKSLLKLGRSTVGAVGTLARESGSRLLKGRNKQQPQQINITVEPAAPAAESEKPAAPAAVEPAKEAAKEATQEAAAETKPAANNETPAQFAKAASE